MCNNSWNILSDFYKRLGKMGEKNVLFFFYYLEDRYVKFRMWNSY